MEKLKKNKKKLIWQQRFLYPLLFQEDFYAIAYNHSLNKMNLKATKNSNLNERFNFFILKRLINRIRQRKNMKKLNKNYNKVFVNYNHNFYSKAIREGFAMILELFFSVQSKKKVLKSFNEWTSYQSIHSVFPFIEDNFLHSNYILNTKIPYFLHPELLIRILRRRIQDASFSHSLRLISHKNKKLITLNTNTFFSQKEMTRLSIFLWHCYICELEFFLVNQWKILNYFKSFSYLISFNQTYCIKKIQHVINEPFWIKLQLFFFHKKKTSFHYVRYENNYIIAIKSSNYLAEKWDFFFSKFWQYYFYYLFKPYRLNIKKISKKCFFFLGYLFGIQIKSIMVKTKMIYDLPKINIIKKELYSITPISSLIQLLARENFCDILGHPISKLAWTTLTDDEIFNRFDQIWRNFFYYYSGCKNKKNLYQIQYILRFSCAKTLACKHKSTIRYVWKKHGSNFFAKSFFFKKQELISLKFFKLYPSIKNFWYLDIVQINSLAKLLQKKILIANSKQSKFKLTIL